MTAQKRGVTHWLRAGGARRSPVVGVARLFRPVMQGLLCTAPGLTPLSPEGWRAGVCLGRVKCRIRPRKHDRSSRHLTGTLAAIPAAHAPGADPPAERLPCQTGEGDSRSGLRAACRARRRLPQRPPEICTRDAMHPAILSPMLRGLSRQAAMKAAAGAFPMAESRSRGWFRKSHGTLAQEGVNGQG